MRVRPGDLIGFSGRGWMSDFINVVTYGIPRWGLSHVGIVGDFAGRRLLFESTTLDEEPCEIQRRCVQGVQAHEVEGRVDKYAGRVWHYPLYRPLSHEESYDLTAFLMLHMGQPYDELGAIRSGGLGLSFIESLLRPECLHSIFCSELVAAAHREVKVFQTYSVSRWSPNRLVRVERHHRALCKPVRLK